MGRLRVTYAVEYDVDPHLYGVETMEQAAEEERQALTLDAAGTLLNLEGDYTMKVEVV